MKPRSLLFRPSSLLAFCTIVMSLSSHAAVPIIDGGAHTVNGAGGVQDGSEQSGYFVKSGSLTINNATLQNFTTTGGAGSGGGAGLGGAVFVNSGATVTLNNVNFTGNSVIGGAGGVGTTGGSLNNLFNSGTALGPAASGYTPNGTDFTDIGGTTGTKGMNGVANANGIGAAGGNGGNGGNGGDRSDSLILGVAAASIDLVNVGIEIAAASGNPFTANVAIGLAPSVATAGINLGSAVAALAYFDKSLADGQIGLGGGAGAGGAGGAGGFGYGGGNGGNGGNGGTGGSNWGGSAYSGGAAGGDAGDGGSGGIGGFGSGGGKGGDGGNGGGGAGVAATNGTAAQEAVYETKVVEATYAKGYYHPTTGAWVQLEGSLSAPINPVVFDHDGLPGTPPVVLQSIQSTPRTEIEILVTPARDAIAANEGGQRPNGADGAGGAGGKGGFGAGAGSEGDGSTTGTSGTGGNGYGGAIFVRDGGTLIIKGDALFDRNATAGGSSTNDGAAGEGAGADLFIMKGSNVILDAGAGHTITFNGGIADDSAASISSASHAAGQGAGLEIRSGRVIFNGENTYTGQTKITGGVLQAQDGYGIHRNSNINLAGGVLQSNGLFNRYLGTGSDRLQWTGSGGFSAEGGDLTVRLNQGQSLTWGAGNFIADGANLIFGSDTATDNVTFVNSIDLGGGTRSILAAANGDGSNLATLSGVLSGSGTLRINDGTHDGIVVLTAANTYSGGTLVRNGTLALKGSGKLNANGAMTVEADGSFDISQTGNQTIGSLAGAGTVQLGGNSLTLNQASNTTFSGVLADGGIGGGTGGSLVKEGVGTLTLGGANTYTGATWLNAGSIHLSGSLASGSVNIASGTSFTNASGGLSATATVTNSGAFILGANDTIGTFTNTGTFTGNGYTLTAGTYHLNSGSVINGNLGSGTLNAKGTVQLNGTSAAGTVNILTGTTTLGSAERLLDTAALDISLGATLVLGGAEKIGSLSGAGSLTNSGYRLTADSGLFSGNISGTGRLTKTSTGTLTISSAQSYTGTTVVSNGTLDLTGSLASDSITIGSTGTLQSGHGGLVSNAGIINDGIFDIGGTDQAIGFIAGSGQVNLGSSTLTLNQDIGSLFTGSFTDGGAVSGTGSLIKAGEGRLRLSGASTHTGGTWITGGSIDLTGSLAGPVDIAAGALLINVNGGLAADAVVTNAGMINLGTNDTIATFNNTGSLNGSGSTLTAVTYNLNSGSLINTHLGTGTINANGIGWINGTSAAGTVNIVTGTTTLGAAERLLDTTALNISSSATLVLGGAEKIGSLSGAGSLTNSGYRLTADSGLFSGNISGTGGLTKTSTGTLTISSAQSYTGATVVSNGTLDLTGSLTSAGITIESAGTLQSGHGGLVSTATVNNAGTFDIGATDETIGTLVNTGLVEGTGTLTATSYDLRSGSVINADLGLGALATTGAVTLNGTSAAGTVLIQTGSTLTLGGSELLADNAAVTIDGTLNLGGVETIYSLFGGGVVNLHSYVLNVTNGGLFTGTMNAGGTTLESTGGTLDLSGSNVNTDNVNLTDGGDLNLTNGGSITTNGVQVDSGSTLFVGDTSGITSASLNIDGTLDLENPGGVDYGTLTGTGTIDTNGFQFVNQSGSTVQGSLTFTGDFRNEGRLAPGFSPDAITIGGNYTEAGVLEIELQNTTPVTGHDQVRVGGTVTIDPSAELVVQTFGGTAPAFGNIYQIISNGTGGAIRTHGTFATVDFDLDGLAGSGAPVGNAAVVYDVEKSQLIATGLNKPGSTFSDLGTNGNQRRAADAIFAGAQIGENQIDSSDPILGTFVRDLLTNGLGASANLATFTPDYYGAMADYAFAGNAALSSQLRSRVSAASAPASGFYAGYTSHSFDTADSVDVNRNDFTAGGDYQVAPGVKVGGTFTYNDGEISSRLGQGDVDGFGLSAYGTAVVAKDFTVFGMAGYSNQDFDLKRSTQQGHVVGSTDADSFVLNAGVRYLAYTHKEISIAPHLVLGYENASVDGFAETGADDALRHGGYDADRITADLGVSAVWETKLAGRPFQLEAVLGLKQVLSDSQDSMTATLVNSPGVSYGIDYADDDSSLINLGLNLGYEVVTGSTVYAGYEGLVGGETNNKFNIGYRYSF